MNMRLPGLAAALLALLTVAIPTLSPAAENRQEAKLVLASKVLEELRNQPDQNVPAWLMQRAYGVAVIPDVIQGAFIFGGRHGTGALSVRDTAGRFSEPVFISLTGGSVGWQIGAQAADVVLIFATRRSVEYFEKGDFTLGGSAAVTAGPLGRQTEAAAGKDAEVYAYTRTRGLFAGVALDGTALTFDSKANRSFYGRETSTDEIAAGKVRSNSESARRFIAALTTLSGNGAPGGNAPAATPATSTAAPAANESGGARTFPLEDTNPGAEPPR
ncbi:MAG: lipid-binding SYLF domain-containing protein [Steroidobacteraceae bacterium]